MSNYSYYTFWGVFTSDKIIAWSKIKSQDKMKRVARQMNGEDDLQSALCCHLTVHSDQFLRSVSESFPKQEKGNSRQRSVQLDPESAGWSRACFCSRWHTCGTYQPEKNRKYIFLGKSNFLVMDSINTKLLFKVLLWRGTSKLKPQRFTNAKKIYLVNKYKSEFLSIYSYTK